MFEVLSNIIIKFRWYVLAGWLGLCAALFTFVPPSSLSSNEHKSFLPDQCEFRKAVKILSQKFPDQCGLCEATIVFTRKGSRITPQDEACINTIATKIKNPDRPLPATLEADLKNTSILSPGMLDLMILAGKGTDAWAMTAKWMRRNIKLPAASKTPEMPNPLKSPLTRQGQSEVIRINLPVEFVTYRAGDMVKYIRDVVEATPRPAGLKVAVTGSAGYGYDHSQFISDSYNRTFAATLIAVIVILLVIYRAPLAAAVPLIGVSLAVAITLKLMNVAQNMGVTIGMAEKIFVCVLMYGAGIDYSLLLIGRYRELVAYSEPHRQAIAQAISATSPAITASAATDSLGILMLIFCDFLIFKTTGPVVAVALLIAMLASMTLVPAMVAIFGELMFWPVKPAHTHRIINKPAHKFWQTIARIVIARPATVLAITIIILVIPATRIPHAKWIYDALAGIKGQYHNSVGNAAAGVELAQDHWAVGEIAPVEMIIVADETLSKSQWLKISDQLSKEISSLPHIAQVRSLSSPMGQKVSAPNGNFLGKLYRFFAARQFLSSDEKAVRIEVLFDIPPMSNEAMKILSQLRQTAEHTIATEGNDGLRIHIAGITAHMQAIREVTSRDFRRVSLLVLGVIFIVVFLLLKDWLLTLIMTASTLLSYSATLGICVIASQLECMECIFGSGGLDWKVEIFLFVVVVAVGVDYNIFLAARIAQESQTAEPAQAIKKALVATGPVISSCGLVMAATLGSLLAGKVELLRQLGFALGVGMLIDTFAVRPLILPAFALLFKRTGRSSNLF